MMQLYSVILAYYDCEADETVYVSAAVAARSHWSAEHEAGRYLQAAKAQDELPPNTLVSSVEHICSLASLGCGRLIELHHI